MYDCVISVVLHCGALQLEICSCGIVSMHVSTAVKYDDAYQLSEFAGWSTHSSYKKSHETLLHV